MELERSLGPVMLWGLGVGYVIAGMYFGWNLGLAQGGTLGLAVATFLVAIMYVTFTLGYTELACALPQAGGAFTYAQKAFGPLGGFLGGLSQNNRLRAQRDGDHDAYIDHPSEHLNLQTADPPH